MSKDAAQDLPVSPITAKLMQADPSSGPPPQPGVLRGGAWLTVQTRHAQRLVKGRPGRADRAPIIGLLGFAHLLHLIWQGARSDDPYADWWLVKVDGALAEARQALEAAQAQARSLREAGSGIELEPAVSAQPARVALQFSNPYAYGGARLLGVYDDFARSVLTAHHVGLVVTEQAERLLHQGARPVRRAYVSALGYRCLAVTRVDLAQGTAQAERARAAMGEVPEEVLVGSLRAAFSPSRGRFDASPFPEPEHEPVPLDAGGREAP